MDNITPNITSSKKLLWMDLEMTGLDIDNDRIIEVACIITNENYEEVDRYEAIIHQPKSIMDAMNEWCKQNHGESGLTERVANEGRLEDEVKAELTSFIQKNFSQDLAILAGNSIHNDRNFIKRWWPEVDELLHYRMLDVSSFKIVMNSRGIEFPKDKAHRALDDIEKSIAELQYYMGYFNHAA